VTNIYYNPSGNPSTGSEGLSAVVRGEFAAIGVAFDMMPQISTTGLFSTVFNQLGNYTFTLPGAPGTLAMLSDVATETTRATTAEGLLAPKASPTFTGAATLAGSAIQTVATLASPPAIGGTAPAAGAFTTLSVSGTMTLTGGAVNLNNATSAWLNWGDNGSASPTFSSRSVGTRLVLWDTIGGATTDYAIGYGPGELWQSVPAGAIGNFAWYGGTTRCAIMTGAGVLTLSGGLTIDGAAGTDRPLHLTTGGLNRWVVRATSTAESGSNAGSNFSIDRYSDGGALIDQPLTITRSTGTVTINDGLFVPSGGVTTNNALVTGAGGNAYKLYDSSQGTDAKFADLEIGGGKVNLRFLNDAYSAASTWLSATRGSGYSTASVAITAPTITLAGAVSATSIDGTDIGDTTPAAGTFVALNASSGNVFSSVGRNRVDNGAFEIAQRTLPVTVSGAFSLDRWAVAWSAGTGSISRGANTAHSSRKQLLASVTGLTVGATATITHSIESARSYDLAGGQVTLSFDSSYTVSAGTASFTVALVYANSLDNFGGVTYIGAPATFTPSGTPATYTVGWSSVPPAAVNGLQLIFTSTQAGATGNLAWALTSVQLEPGVIGAPVATPFERLSPAQSLANCQRFFQAYNGFQLGLCANAGGTFTAPFMTFPTMRALPTAVLSSLSYGNATAMTLIPSSASGASTTLTVTVAGNAWANYGLTLSADL
jgi:hypothetical protein